jgi:hypothetical protein
VGFSILSRIGYRIFYDDLYDILTTRPYAKGDETDHAHDRFVSHTLQEPVQTIPHRGGEASSSK